MNKGEKAQITKVLERLARIEERSSLNFKHIKESLEEIKKSVKTINQETGKLEERIGLVENLYHEAKARYDKMSFYWKLISVLVSPIITFVVILIIKIFLGLPLP